MLNVLIYQPHIHYTVSISHMRSPHTIVDVYEDASKHSTIIFYSLEHHQCIINALMIDVFIVFTICIPDIHQLSTFDHFD